MCSVADEKVDHPSHYGGKDNPYEAIKLIESWGLGFKLGNALKYILRAPHKGNMQEDLRKAVWYIRRHWEIPDRPPFKIDSQWLDPSDACEAWKLGPDLTLTVRAIAWWASPPTAVPSKIDGKLTMIQCKDLLVLGVVRIEELLADMDSL